MQGTVEYYNNCFKSQILNNMVDNKYSLEQIYLNLLEDIKSKNTNQVAKDQLYRNLDKAYKYSYQEIFGVTE
ncbi:MAG: hypothetical protein ACI35R_17740 [Bacillus sp. (in: firmicutes)]